MTKRAQYEVIALVVLCGIFGFFLLNGLFHARTVVRDDLRRQDITNLKRAAEQYNNAFTYYPTPPDGSVGCTESSLESWLFGEDSPLVTGHFINAIPHDVREERGHIYRYCVTDVSNQKAVSYFFEATLEIDQPEGTAFDEDEDRKFDYRILHEDGKTLYRVCGGEESQCKSM